jgi:N-acetyl-gamma-glutamyl-phosphate reductase
MKLLKAAIVGAAGYTGEELVRLLAAHPQVEVTCVTSRSHNGKSVGEVFPRYADLDLYFSAPDLDELKTADVVFLCLPHGLAAEYAVPLHEAGKTIIDVSADFRLRDAQVYAETYGGEHPAPALLDDAVYGLPERYREKLRSSQLTACPGCYPTSILLPLLPLLEARLISPENILAASLSGVSGAGRKEQLPYLFAECNESMRPYGAVGHRHVAEIEQELTVAAGQSLAIQFVPHLIPVTRGMHSTIFATTNGVCDDAVRNCWTEAYQHEPFVRVLPKGKLADSKNVTRTNVCELGVAFDSRTHRVIISSAIDNLTKGAAGQAVQCMNVRFGLPETAGLH